MSRPGFRGRGCPPRGRKLRGVRNPQPNFNQSRRENRGPNFWIEHLPPPIWQQINGYPPPSPQSQQFVNFESHRYRGRPLFNPALGVRGKGTGIRGEGRSRPGLLATSGFRGRGPGRPPQVEPLRFLPLGSEEERQHKIAETADKLKQKLSSLTVTDTINFWEDDISGVSFSHTEEQVISNKAIPELNLTVNDFKDIGRVGSENSLNAGDFNDVIVQEQSESKVAEATKDSDPIDQRNLEHENISTKIEEPQETVENFADADRFIQSVEVAKETAVQHPSDPVDNQSGFLNHTKNQVLVEHSDFNQDYDQNTLTPDPTTDFSSNQGGIAKNKDDTKIKDEEAGSQPEPEFSKVREKLREVIRVEQKFEKKENAGLQHDNKTTVQCHEVSRLQPDVRLDSHLQIGIRPQRFQSPNNIQPQFRSEHSMRMQPNFRPDFQSKFNYAPKNVNISPRLQCPQIIPSEFNGRPLLSIGSEIAMDLAEPDMEVTFDPREPPPRLNAPLFNPNQLPPKFCSTSNLNGFQPPPSFHQRGPPPRFINHNQESSVQPPIAPNLIASPPVTDFSQVPSAGYPQMCAAHCSGYPPIINGSFNPAIPPPNTAPSIVSQFPPPAVPSISSASSTSSSPFSVEPQTMMQLPPVMVIKAFGIQPPPPPSHPPPVTPVPPPLPTSSENLYKETDKQSFSPGNDNLTPNMNDELEDMQEALEFAKQLMNMTNDEEDNDNKQNYNTTFNMPVFADLSSIPSPESSCIVKEELSIPESINYDNNETGIECRQRKDQDNELNLQASSNECTTTEDLQIAEEEEKNLSIDNHMRPRVIFNVNTKAKITWVDEWQSQSGEGSTKPRKLTENILNPAISLAKEGKKSNQNLSLSEKKCDTKLQEKKSNQKNKRQRKDADKKRETKNSEDSKFSVANLEDNFHCKADTNDAINIRASGSKRGDKSLPGSAVDTNWKDKVIKQFLKMSKNDICNMVNSSSLRKFDIAMKHLVKEKKYSLSKESRCSADDVVKGYDMSREEFMNQLSAMLDPSATVDIENLPTKFIRHLGEVLKLDVESHLNDTAASSLEINNTADDLFGNIDMNDNNDNNNYQNNSVSSSNQQDFVQLPDFNIAPLEKNYSGANDCTLNIETQLFPNLETEVSVHSRHSFADTQENNNPNKNSDDNENLPNLAALDDIFSAGLARARLAHKSIAQKTSPAPLLLNENRIDDKFSHGFVQPTRSNTPQISEENINCDNMFSLKDTETKAITNVLEKSETRHEITERWCRKKCPDPDMYRNLTKEEWEARYAKSSNKSVEKESLLLRKDTPPRCIINAKSSIFENRQLTRNQSPPLSMTQVNLSPSIMYRINDENNKQSRLGNKNSVTDSNNDLGSDYLKVSNDKAKSATPIVKKCSNVMKKQEKIVKNRSLNEILKNEVNNKTKRTKQKHKARQREREIRRIERNKRRKESREKCKRKRRSFTPESEEETLLREDQIKTEIFLEEKSEFKEEKVVNEIEKNELLANHNCPPNLKKPNAVDSQKQAQNKDYPGHLNCTTNTEGTLDTDKNVISLPIQESSCEIQPNEAPPLNCSDQNKICNVEKKLEKSTKNAEIKTSVPTQTPLKDSHLKELLVSMPTEISLEDSQQKKLKNTFNDSGEKQLSKSGAKKIDIQAYKARKMHSKIEKPDDKMEKSEPLTTPLPVNLLDVPSLSSESVNNIEDKQKQRDLENIILQDQNEQRQMNSSDNCELTELIEQFKETEIMQHQINEKPNEKFNSDNKLDANKLKNHLKDIEKSVSCEENNKTCKEMSKCSIQKIIVISKDFKKPKVLQEKTEKYKKIKTNVEESRLVQENILEKNSDTKNQNQCSKQSASYHDSNEISVDEKNMKDDVTDKIENNLMHANEPTNVKIKCEEISADKNKVLEQPELSEVIIDNSTESSIKNDLHFEKSQENIEKLAPGNENQSVQNNLKDCSITGEEVLSLSVEDNKSRNEPDSVEPDAESSPYKNESTEVSDNFNNDSLKLCPQSCDSEVKLIVDDLVHEVVSQLDLLNDINKVEDNVLKENKEIVISSLESAEAGLGETSEYTSLDLNSPATPESPLKGFSEESIKNSILGKRKLVQSVLKETEDYITNKKSKNFDDILLEAITENDIVSENSKEITSNYKSEIDNEVNEPVEEEGTKCTSHVATTDEKFETCARAGTPSGDTLSLGSSIDLDNSEFIVLSELSSDANFSQDESSKPKSLQVPERETQDTFDLNSEQERRKEVKDNDISEDTSLKNDNVQVLTTIEDVRFETTKSSDEICSITNENIKINVPDLAEPSEGVVDKNSNQSSELESSQKKDCDMIHVPEIKATISEEESKEKFSQETPEVNKTVMGDEGNLSMNHNVTGNSSHHNLGPINDLPVDDQNLNKKISVVPENDISKIDKGECNDLHVESDKKKHNDTSHKNMHKVKRTHRTKHKKEKELKINEKKIKESLRDKDLVTVVEKPRTKEGVMARMIEIDVEIHKLMSEKMKLYQMLESGELPTEQSLTVGKDDKTSLQNVKGSHKESDPHLFNNEIHRTSLKLNLDSRVEIDHSHLKSLKNIISGTSVIADDIVNRNSGNEQNTIIKKKDKKTEEEETKKPHKRDKSTPRHNSVANCESKSEPHRKASPKRLVDAKSSVTKREKHKKNDHDQSSRQHEGKSSSLNLEHGKHKNVEISKSIEQETTFGKFLLESGQKSKKTDHHNGSRKKINKITDSRSNTLTKDEQHCDVNDEIDIISKTCSKSSNTVPNRQLSQISTVESSQISENPDCTKSKKICKDPISVKEPCKQDKKISRKRKKANSCKKRKSRLKSLFGSSGNVLSLSEEEMPLNLLYVKKIQKKQEAIQNTENSSTNNKVQIPNANAKTKSSSSTDKSDHVEEVINAVVKNTFNECKKLNEIEVKIAKISQEEDGKIIWKAKTFDKTKQNPIHSLNSSIIHEIVADWSSDDTLSENQHQNFNKSLAKDNCSNNFTNLGKSNEENVIDSGKKPSMTLIHDDNNKLPTDKINVISKENTGDESRTDVMTIESKSEIILLMKPIDREAAHEILDCANKTRISSEEWNIADSKTSELVDPVSQILNCDVNDMPEDLMSSSNSVSLNINPEKGLHISDEMLEIVDSGLEKTSSKEIALSEAKRPKRKRMISELDGNVSAKKKSTMTRIEMMNCSVRLVDCKYTHLKNRKKSTARQKSKISTKKLEKLSKLSYTQQHSDTNPAQMHNSTESCARIAKSKSYSPQLTTSKELTDAIECPDWSFKKVQLVEDNKSLSPSSSEHYITEKSDLDLNDMKQNSENDVNDPKIIRVQNSSGSLSLRESNCLPRVLIEAGNQRQGCDRPIMVTLDSEENNSLDCETNASAICEQPIKHKQRAKPLTKSMDLKVPRQRIIKNKVESTKIEAETSEDSKAGEKKLEECASKHETDSGILNQSGNKDLIEVEGMESLRIQYNAHKGPILDVKVFGDSILAASEDGKIYRYSQTCNEILNTYEGHKSAVTCMFIMETDSTRISRDWLFSASLDGSLRCYDMKNSGKVRSATDIGSPVQCMDQSWGIIFLGTKSGCVSRFHIKLHSLRDEEIKFSEESVLALKATTEGPRRVLIVASRSQPITIRDAQTGLFLRTISGHKSHTVYSLMMEKNLVYCGTSSTAIPVFDFINGSQVQMYNAGPGIVCMRMYKWLLFAGCYDGNIYVFDTKEQKLVCSIPGPGNMLLSMDTVNNKIVAGSKDRRLHMWQMPEQIQALLVTKT